MLFFQSWPDTKKEGLIWVTVSEGSSTDAVWPHRLGQKIIIAHIWQNCTSVPNRQEAERRVDGERPEEEKKSPQRHDKSELLWAGCLCRYYHGLVQKYASYLRCLLIQSGWQPQLTIKITIFIYPFDKPLMITMWMPGTRRRSLGITSMDTLLLGVYILRVYAKDRKTDVQIKQYIELWVKLKVTHGEKVEEQIWEQTTRTDKVVPLILGIADRKTGR